MKNEINDIEKAKIIKELIIFLEINKPSLKKYINIESFKDNINELYRNVSGVNYDLIEYDIPNNLDIIKTNLYFYYSTFDLKGNNKISIINKSLDKFYFIEIKNDVYCKIIKYFKNEKNNMSISKKQTIFKTIDNAEKFKHQLLKSLNKG